MSLLTVTVPDPLSSMPVRTTVLNPGQREGQRVCAGPQIDDAVLPGAVGHDRANLFDQRRARRFDGHARKDPSRGVSDHSGERLCIRDGRQRRDEPQKQEHSQYSFLHVVPLEAGSIDSRHSN